MRYKVIVRKDPIVKTVL